MLQILKFQVWFKLYGNVNGGEIAQGEFTTNAMGLTHLVFTMNSHTQS